VGTRAADIAARQPLRYAGYVFDVESGLYYCSQRYYDPSTCQFLSKDPARADGEQTAYGYCGGEPVGSVNPKVTGGRRNPVAAWPSYPILNRCASSSSSRG
jgi:RHS repeat-associated protein